MKVTKLKTNNFQGLKGVQEFEFGKITALAQPNGSGKTSLINALRFALTGIEPSGELITKGAASTEVRVEFENGSNFLRQKFAEKGKNAKYYVGNSSTTLSKLNEYIMHEMGGLEVTTAKTISSGELLTSMTSQQFGEMLLRYLPEAMTVDTVLERFPNANQSQQAVVKECLPQGEFAIEKLNEFHQLLVERRKLIKQKIAQHEAVLQSLGEEAPKYSLEELEGKINELLAKRDVLVKAQANLENYNRISEQIKQRDLQIQQIDKELSQLVGKEHTAQEQQLLVELLNNARTNAQTIQNGMVALVQAKKNLDLAIENISKPVCPLSDKIICTVDKTPVLDELKEQRENLVKNYTEQKEAFLKATQDIADLENRHQTMVTEVNNFARIQDKQKQKQQLLAQELTLPPKPEEAGSMDALNKELVALQNMLPIVQNYSKKDKLITLLDEYKKKLADYEGLVQAFSPKGEVKEAITSYYMDEFAAPCNEKASRLFPGMKLRFITDKGVKVLTDPNGSGEYLEFSSLSGGEQASVMFLLVSMLSSLSGMGIIILDELSVLDGDVFRNLIKVLKENEDEYDMCLIASVDHGDTLETLSEYNVPIITVNTSLTAESNSSVDNDQDKETHKEEKDSESDLLSANSKEKEPENKTKTLEELKNLMNQTMKDSADMRFVPSDNDLLEEELMTGSKKEHIEQSTNFVNAADESEETKENLEVIKPSIEDLKLNKGKSLAIIEFIKSNVDENNFFNGTAKDVSIALDISQPTVGKVLKKLQDHEFILSLKRGSWKVSDELLGL